MDLLAIAVADPTVLPLWGAFLFAVGMWPVGMFFGCNTCCDPCVCSSGESLPETITVTLNGFTDYSKRQICTLSFSACYGSGGSGTVDAPGQSAPESDPVDDRGPITAVSLTDGGSGYAKLGRAAPTVTVSSVTGSGTGATFDVTLAQQQDSCGLDRWVVKSVSQTGGTGYANGDQLQFTVAEGDTVETAATAVFAPQYGEPTLSLSVSGGTGGVLTIDGYNKLSAGSDAYYGIGSVTVANGGSGYADDTQATITLGTGDEKSPPSATPDIRIRTEFRPPNDEWTLTQYENGEPIPTVGTGLVISLALVPAYAGATDYEASAVTVVAGGSGHSVGEVFTAAADEGGTVIEAELEITSVGSGGEVTGIALLFSGQFAGIDTGVIDRVEFGLGGWRGAYRKLLSSSGITVTNGGAYYREDASLPPYVATVTVNINQGYNTPSAGTGAVITATVEDDPQSPDFGVITGLAVQNGGDGYLAWVWETNDCCGHYLNGQSIVLTRFKDSNAAACEAATKDFLGQYNIPFSVDGQYYSVPSDCVYTTQFCGGWTEPFLQGPIWNKHPTNSKLQLYVGYRGEGQRPLAKLGLHCYGGIGSDGGWGGCGQDWIADEPIESCSQFSFSATPSGRPSISVTPGGTYESDWRFAGCNASGACQSCNVCCQGDGESPDEIEVIISDEWTTNRPPGMPNFSGTYVAPGSGNYWEGGANTNFLASGFQVGLYPCHSGVLPMYRAPLRDDCETCIKKCRVWFGGMNFQWLQGGLYLFARIAPAEPSNDCGDCEDTPVCSPSGKTFSLSIAESNPGVIGYGNGTHVATATIE
jgi:hypothetical protein